MIHASVSDRVAALLSGRAPLIVAAVAGGSAALGLQPLGFWLLTVLGLLILPWCLAQAGHWYRAALIGWLWGVGYFTLAMAWIVEPFLVDIARHGWMAPFALIFMASGLALFWGAATGGAHALGHDPMRRTVALCATSGLAELARAYVLTGFPWAAVPQTLIDTPMAQLLAWIGPHGLGFWFTGAVMLPGAALVAGGADRLGFAMVPLSFLVVATWGVLPPEATFTGKTARVIQPNAPQDQKWDPAHIDTFFARQVAYTGADLPPDLIVWPETAISTFLQDSDPAFTVIAEIARGTPVVLGVQRRDDVRYYNSLVVLDPLGEVSSLYDKHHLVPFGEYMPFGRLAAKFGIYGLAAEDGAGFSAGPGPKMLDIPRIGQAIPLICYEAVFPQGVHGTAGRADVLLQITNDAWFGTWSGPYQHFAQARMRAIEQGLPLVRSANTGISAIIDPYGRPTVTIPLGVPGFADGNLPAPLPPTTYARSGDWPIFVLLAMVASGLLAPHVMSFRRNRD
ncbi:MAG: apolipoprotein N-acyltransferase [Rhodobacteraceae bacterium]|nr:apolipoprotein N-acyltransferase [Paracoccaceae bacterium]